MQARAGDHLLVTGAAPGSGFLNYVRGVTIDADALSPRRVVRRRCFREWASSWVSAYLASKVRR